MLIMQSWYKFVLGSCYGFLLTFGFIMMTPQLFINYKLKSVAHLPWRMMTYKALNTFIDDILAFVINMPTMYRIGCFRTLHPLIFLLAICRNLRRHQKFFKVCFNTKTARNIHFLCFPTFYCPLNLILESELYWTIHKDFFNCFFNIFLNMSSDLKIL